MLDSRRPNPAIPWISWAHAVIPAKAGIQERAAKRITALATMGGSLKGEKGTFYFFR
jgi:hypothetical protein